MSAFYFISSFCVAFFILIPLSLKWEIELKYAFLGVAVFGGISGFVLSIIVSKNNLSLPLTILIEAAVVIFLTSITIFFSFQRDPERAAPAKGRNIIVSPADGKIVYIRKVKNGEVPLSEKKGKRIKLEEFLKLDYLKSGEAYQVGIVMNFLDVHVTRAPVAGFIKCVMPIPGKFLSLKKEESILKNERLTTLIQNERMEVAVVHIASRLVRRIVPFIRESQKVNLGERIGIIKFGSQVDILIPVIEELKTAVRPGDRVIAGVSIIAEY